MIKISVIICTHNPRPDYLERVLGALKTQSLPRKEWEMLLVDNASEGSMVSTWDLSWHPNARYIREEELGLTPARLRGISESQAEILIFVDDDNVLAPDYLSAAWELVQNRPWIGAFGGNIAGEFETDPVQEIHVMFGSLAVLEVKNEIWAFLPGKKIFAFAPYGAGLVIRRKVADYYARMVVKDPLRRMLGRKGASLAACEDIDIGLCSHALGLAIGRFPQLQMTHLIPSARLDRGYLLRLNEEIACSQAILLFIWDGCLPQVNEMKPCRSERLFRFYQGIRNRMRGGEKVTFGDELKRADHRGVLKAVQILQALKSDGELLS